MKQKVEALQHEKEMMAQVPVADNDILTVNVGGTHFLTKRATLTQVNQLLASALAPRSDQLRPDAHAELPVCASHQLMLDCKHMHARSIMPILRQKRFGFPGKLPCWFNILLDHTAHSHHAVAVLSQINAII